MISLWVFCAFIGYSYCTIYYHDIDLQPRIVGGYYAKIDGVPYQAQVTFKDVQICGATIISDLWLISAAHCFRGILTDPSNIVIKTGSTIPGQGESHPVRKIIVHENFTMKAGVTNDISLIKLKRPIRFNQHQNKIEISNTSPKDGDTVLLSGYGKESQRGSDSPYLKVAYAPVVGNKVCAERHYPTAITDDMFCAGDGSSDTCQGDSGGPAVMNNELVGITSFGRDCGSKKYPGVYTKVSNYRRWIFTKTRWFFF